ncbi:hypothetical protein KI659_12065 [Litoribacter alkaliphilus]|uniref:DUF3551 domain-containing protein n=1 Tax=Litoribacter ruber TaxID=702568 RepID=A0AAP2CLF0_9BACT|nr:hypothetical protein [Litoribacter alkaliphilus]MBS9524745.1 hypothetical protein [Litoribacter alkaliphilus]
MISKNLKTKLACLAAIPALFLATNFVEASTWCRWNDELFVCQPEAPGGYCAVASPNCDVPVVE